MRKLLRRFWADPVWSKVIAAGIVAAIGAVIVGTWWSESLVALVAVWQFFRAATPVPNWLLGILILSALATVGLGIVLIYAVVFTPAAPTFREYVEDEFLGIRWRWRYYNHRPAAVAPFCPLCDFQIIPRHASAYVAVDRFTFRCDSCGRFERTFDLPVEEIESVVIRQIQQKLRNNTWQNAVRAS